MKKKNKGSMKMFLDLSRNVINHVFLLSDHNPIPPVYIQNQNGHLEFFIFINWCYIRFFVCDKFYSWNTFIPRCALSINFHITTSFQFLSVLIKMQLLWLRDRYIYGDWKKQTRWLEKEVSVRLHNSENSTPPKEQKGCLEEDWMGLRHSVSIPAVISTFIVRIIWLCCQSTHKSSGLHFLFLNYII